MRLQARQVDLMPQSGAEGGDRLGRIVFPAVEAAIYECLQASAQWAEERGDQQRGGDDDDGLLLLRAAGKDADQRLPGAPCRWPYDTA